MIAISAFFLSATVAKADSTSTISTASTSTATSTSGIAVPTLPQGTIIWPDIKAAGAIVYDPISSKVLYQKDADTIRPIASLAKLMTASVADTILNWSDALSNKPVKIATQKDYDQGDKLLKNGTLWMPRDLLKYMLVGSSNKAAETISRTLVDQRVFLSLMNHSAKEWGLASTTFNNVSGLSINLVQNPVNKYFSAPIELPGALSTPRELAYMMWHIIENHPDLLSSTREPTVTFNAGKGTADVTVKNTNTALGALPIVFGKTGFTDLAGGNLAVVIQKNNTSHPYVIVVLGSTLTDRFNDVISLASTTQQIIGFQQ